MRMEHLCPPQSWLSIFPRQHGMVSISKVNKNLHIRNIFKTVPNIQIFSEYLSHNGLDRLDSGCFPKYSCYDSNYSKYFYMPTKLKIFSLQEPPPPRTSWSWRATPPPGSSSPGTHRPSPTQRTRSNTGQHLKYKTFLQFQDQDLSLWQILFEGTGLICKLFDEGQSNLIHQKQTADWRLFCFHFQFTKIVFLH